MRAGKFLIFTFFCLFGYSRADVATNTFTVDLMRVIYGENSVKENTVMSSLGVYDLLALLQQGSGGNSLTELTTVLHAPADATRQRYRQIVRSLMGEHSESELEFANRIYLQDQFSIEESFRSIAVDDFLANIVNINFGNNVQAADIINNWVNEQTHGRIQDLIQADSISSDTAMILLNAIFFAGNWTYQFDAQGTHDAPFTTSNCVQKTVSMMHLSKLLVAGEIEELNAKFVRLPFNGDEFSMIFIVPNEDDGLNSVINLLQEDHLDYILNFTEKRNVDLSLPKFKFSTTSQLVPTLKTLGLQDIFTAAADLTGIAHTPPLYVSDALQKAEIELDERGVTASAATSITVTAETVPINVLSINANHPFMFYILEDADALPLFSGWVVEL